MITVFMVNSHNGIIDIVDYFDNDGKMKKADFSKLQLSSDDVDYDRLAKMIESEEYDINKKDTD